MARQISAVTRLEVVEALRARFAEGSKLEKKRILDEFVAISGYHRKHAVKLLRHGLSSSGGIHRPVRRIYDEAVCQALIVMWEAADRICGKRLKALLPTLMDSMEEHGYLKLAPEVREKVAQVSAATIDRLLSPARTVSRSRPKRKTRMSKPKETVPVRTYAGWDDPAPGFFEVDFVEHNGGDPAGSYVHSLVLTDIASGWTECLPLAAREQSLVVEGIEILRAQMPMALRGIDTDNDAAFLNDTVLQYCRNNGIDQTRSRPYRKNDQAWIEQKNGAIVRRFMGYERFSGLVAARAIARLYQLTRLYVNFFQPSFKLVSKQRVGAKVKKLYEAPATPCDRLLQSPRVSDETKHGLQTQRAKLDPTRLLHGIRELQSVLASLSGPDSGATPVSKSLEDFLSQLPHLWHEGEVRPTHRRELLRPRAWRTRQDPFESVWPKLLGWLQQTPDATAMELFSRLCADHPGTFDPGQLRTLQRRVRDWRRSMAKALLGQHVSDS